VPPQYVKDAGVLIVNANLELAGFAKSLFSIRTKGSQIESIRPMPALRHSGLGASSGTKPDDVIDAQGRIVLPGFIDAHAHLLSREFDALTVDFAASCDVDEMLAMVEQKAAELQRDKFVVGINWDDSKVRGIERLDRQLLDALGVPNPVFLQRVCGHKAFVNSRALEVLCSSTDFGEVSSHVDRERGEIGEDAIHLMRQLVPLEHSDRVKGVRRAIDEALSLGVTSICEMHALPEQFAVLRDAARDIEIFAYLDYVSGASFDGLKRLEPSELCRPAGLKLVADGSIGARTAAVSRPFWGTDERGELLLSREAMAAVAREALKRGIQLAVHAIGDRAIDAVVGAFEDAGVGFLADHRHRIEHLEILPEPLDEHLERLRRSGLVASMQPGFITSWGHEDGLYGERFGPGWAKTNAFGPVARAGVPLCFGSDSMPIGPIYGLRGAVRHPFPDFAMPLADAISAHTVGGAFAVRQEARLGRIREGMAADLVILGCKSASELLEARVVATIKAGRLVYRAKGYLERRG